MNYSITSADLSREIREELYDGTARITFIDPDGNETVTLVESDEQPPEPDPLEILQQQVDELTLLVQQLTGDSDG
jgi:hypothetical protein